MSLIGDIASVLSVLIAVVGFGITIMNVIESKRAADRAESAANQTLERVRYVDTVENLSKAITIIAEIQRLNRAKEWKVLLDRHLEFRSILTEIRGSTPQLNGDHKAVIQSGITHSSSMSNKIEIALGQEDQEPNIPQMNKILSKQVEKFGDILVEMRVEADG